MSKSFLLLFLFFQISTLNALYNGNPSFPMMPEEGIIISKESWLGIKLGYEWDDIFDRKMRVQWHNENLTRDVQNFHMMGNYGVITFGLSDRVEAYGLLGAMETHVHQSPRSGTSIRYSTHNDFAWEIGGRAILAYWGDLQLGLDAKFFQSSPSFSSMSINGSQVNPQGAKMNYSEWQIGMGASYRIRMVIPYIGMKFSSVWAKFNHLNAISSIYPKKNFAMKNHIPLGIFLGIGLSPDRIININAEVQLIDETAVTVSGDIRF